MMPLHLLYLFDGNDESCKTVCVASMPCHDQFGRGMILRQRSYTCGLEATARLKEDMVLRPLV